VSKLVCVFGISGVGKSTMLREYVRKHPGWTHIIASEVLAEATRQNAEALRTAERGRIESNQRLAVRNIQSLRAQYPACNVALDAHCVIDNGQELVRVPVTAIQELQPASLICIWDDAVRILERRLLEVNKLRPTRSAQQLEEYQTAVILTCEDYGESLGLDLARVRAGDINALEKALLN
jgi:adenylate kinase